MQSREATAKTAASASTTQAKAKANNDDEPPKKRPTRQTFQQFVELARPEAPAFLTALLAVAVVRGFVLLCGDLKGLVKCHHIADGQDMLFALRLHISESKSPNRYRARVPPWPSPSPSGSAWTP